MSKSDLVKKNLSPENKGKILDAFFNFLKIILEIAEDEKSKKKK